MFVMLNLVTAVIVENAFSDSKSEEKELAVRLEREKAGNVSLGLRFQHFVKCQEEELEDLKQFFLARYQVCQVCQVCLCQGQSGVCVLS